MSLSAKEAAELVGMSKPGIVKAIKCGKLSAEKDIHGEWRVEPVELFRVYEPVGNSTHQPQPQSLLQDASGWQREIQLLREMLLAKDEVIRAKDDALEDLRRAMLMLESAQPPQPRRQGFWARLVGGQ